MGMFSKSSTQDSDNAPEMWQCGRCGKWLPVAESRCPEIHAGPDYE